MSPRLPPHRPPASAPAAEAGPLAEPAVSTGPARMDDMFSSEGAADEDSAHKHLAISAKGKSHSPSAQQAAPCPSDSPTLAPTPAAYSTPLSAHSAPAVRHEGSLASASDSAAAGAARYPSGRAVRLHVQFEKQVSLWHGHYTVDRSGTEANRRADTTFSSSPFNYFTLIFN